MSAAEHRSFAPFAPQPAEIALARDTIDEWRTLFPCLSAANKTVADLALRLAQSRRQALVVATVSLFCPSLNLELREQDHSPIAGPEERAQMLAAIAFYAIEGFWQQAKVHSFGRAMELFLLVIAKPMRALLLELGYEQADMIADFFEKLIEVKYEAKYAKFVHGEIDFSRERRVCNASSKPLVKDQYGTCSRCGNAHYCNKQCQRAHWKAVHKAECTHGHQPWGWCVVT